MLTISLFYKQASREVSTLDSFEVYFSHDYIANFLLFPLQENGLWR